MSSSERSFHCAQALLGGGFAENVRVVVSDDEIVSVSSGAVPSPGDITLGLTVPGFANAHSHAFHRLLRGRTHAGGGDFWQWRARMYKAAASLNPDVYRSLAHQVFREMRNAGYTSVGEFHYIHHDPSGHPYPGHAMEMALATAAIDAGIRLVLLDVCYLNGGVAQPLAAEQQRFGDRDVRAWLARWHSLRDALADLGSKLITLGAAIHSVRAVTPNDLSVIADGLPSDVALHAHVSEQTRENVACQATYGMTPVALLAAHGLITPRFSAVHATHLTEEDIRVLGAANATVVMCPTTEADLGDGIGPAPELLAAGARLAIGSDQHVVIDPFEELSRLELDQRLRHQRRGVFTLQSLWSAGTSGGDRSLHPSRGDGASLGFRVGDPFDAIAIDTTSPRSSGSEPMQLPMVARSSDVSATVIGGSL